MHLLRCEVSSTAYFSIYKGSEIDRGGGTRRRTTGIVLSAESTPDIHDERHGAKQSNRLRAPPACVCTSAPSRPCSKPTGERDSLGAVLILRI